MYYIRIYVAIIPFLIAVLVMQIVYQQYLLVYDTQQSIIVTVH